MKLLYYDLQMEGEDTGTPGPEDPYKCNSCQWQGVFRELATKPLPPAAAEFDYQI